MTELVQFSTAESGAWREALRRFAPGDDIYFRPEYAAISEANGEGQAECLLVTEGASALLLPVLKQSIPGHPALCDVQSPYGYGGPLVVGAEAGFLGRAWRLIREKWLHDGVVAAFLRGRFSRDVRDFKFFFHYMPSVFQLHMHVCLQHTGDTLRIHSLQSVLLRLKIDDLWFQRALILCPLRRVFGHLYFDSSECKLH